MKPMSAKAVAVDYVSRVRQYLDGLDLDAVDALGRLLDQARRGQHAIYVVGNGGSASTAAHIATDWSYVAFRSEQDNCRVFSLTDNSAMITALGNDVSYADVFSGQLRVLLQPGDVVVAVSASGNSENVVRAVEVAQRRGAVTVGLVGFDGGRLRDLCDHVVHVKTLHGDYGPVEDIHLMINHILTTFLRQAGREEEQA